MQSHRNPEPVKNVTFELGFFIGELGDHRVCGLRRSSVELPSDYSGIVYVLMDDVGWKVGLAKELREAGFEIDMNLL